ncbi:NAD(P)/FAD-dependent oxidoreductase [Marinobacteraceae bacterium S3BR75-40.1]
MNSPIHHIVIVGGGAGGMELATKLGRRLDKRDKARITLVDAVPTHVWKPLLHEVATGSLDSAANEVNYRAHAKRHHYEFQLGRMTGLDRASKHITLAPINDEKGAEVVPQRTLHYDTLVMAIGSTANDFGTPGAQEHCLFLDSLDQARRFHRLLLNTYLRKNYQAERPQEAKLRISIIGAGATGVELAAELRHASRELPSYGLKEMRASNVEITVVEAADRILPALPERLSRKAHRELERLDIGVLAGNPVAEVQADRLRLKDGREQLTDMCVWAAGIKAPEWLAELDGLETNRINQLVVHQDLSSTRDPDVFAFGDCAACPQPDSDRPVPPRAQAAHQQASLLLRSLERRLEGESPLPYQYRDYGSLINFSRYTAVGNLMGNISRRSLLVEGKIARLFYISLYHMHQLALHGVIRTAMLWLNDKINRRLQPRLKLH